MACCPRSPGPTLLSLVLPTPCAQPERPECERPLAEGSLSPGGSNLPQQEPQLESLPTFKPSPLWKSLVSFHVTGEPRVAPEENPRLSQAETDRVWGAEGRDMRGSLPRMPDTNGAEAPRAPHQLSSQPDKVP